MIPPVISQGTHLIENAPQLLQDLMKNETIKQLNTQYGLIDTLQTREYKILRELTHLNAPCVEQVAVVEGRVDANGEELPCAIVTRFLPYSLPYRVLLSGAVTAHEITTMASALALLLVRLHLLGFWWGDCSLSNTLFRRDAEGFAAYLVDAETCELQKTLSDGQREHDLEIGHFIGCGIFTLIALTQSWVIGLIAFVAYVVYVQVENYIVTPRIMKRTLSVPGAVTIIAALIGSSLLGLVGGLLAVPVAASIILIPTKVPTRAITA